MCGLNQSHVFIGAITDRYELIRSELQTKPIFAQRSEHHRDASVGVLIVRVRDAERNSAIVQSI